MKKLISILLTMIIAMASVVAFAEGTLMEGTFSIRNGIVYGDSINTVKEKEELGIAEETSSSLTTIEGTIASIANSTITYSFSADGSLYDVLMDFGVHIGKPQQAISAYNTVFEALCDKYGEPFGQNLSTWYVIYGSAVEDYSRNASFLKNIGLTPALQGSAQWILRYEDINVKIDLLRHGPNGPNSSDVIVDKYLLQHLFDKLRTLESYCQGVDEYFENYGEESISDDDKENEPVIVYDVEDDLED